MTTLLEAYTAHVDGMDVKDRREAAFGFMFMQFDTLIRRGSAVAIPSNIKPVSYVHAFMDQFSDLEIIGFKPTITAPKRP